MRKKIPAFIFLSVTISAVGVYYLYLQENNLGINTELKSTFDYESQQVMTNSDVTIEAKAATKVNDFTIRNGSFVNSEDQSQSKHKTNALPTEEVLLSKSGETFDSEYVNSVLSSSTYHDKLAALQEEQLNNPNATRITQDYVELFEVFPEISDNVELELNDLSCGLKLCMGSVSTFDDGDTWRRLIIDHLGNSNAVSFGALVSYPIQIDENTVEHRFVFSTDPAAGIISAPIEDGQLIYNWGNNDGSTGQSGSEDPIDQQDTRGG